MWILDELKKKSECAEYAIIHREAYITFAELWRRSDMLAEYLKSSCKTAAPVVIYGNKDIDITVAMLAALKSGRAYVPLDITYPVQRVKSIMEELENEVIFNFSEIPMVQEESLIEIEREDLQEIYAREVVCTITEADYVTEASNCYILFTSGSTGKAKGVQITKRNILNFTSWFSGFCELSDQKQVVLNQVSYSFDVSVIPLYIYMAMGKTLFNIDKAMLDDTKLLFRYLETSRVAAWVSTPAFLEICSFDDSFQAAMLPELEKIILAGEVLTKTLVRSMRVKFPQAEVINGYGPTEGTVLLSACTITEQMLEDEKSLPIGYVLDGADYAICDSEEKAVEKGMVGELTVTSNSISSGYFKNPEQTKKAFFHTGHGVMGYRTGDLVYESEGLLYYVARKDTQIKLNGFRIELSDISSNLNRLEMVHNSVVLPKYKEERVSYLAAFVTLNMHPELSDLKIGMGIKKQLKEWIPSYMVPRKIIILDQFPMNINGKIDRKRLAEEYL